MVLISGDFNVNYLASSEQNLPLEATLRCYNLSRTVDFTTIIQAVTSSAIDSIFTDTFTTNYYSISSLTNGLSDHDTLWSRTLISKGKIFIFTQLETNKYCTPDFQIKLSYESCDDVSCHDHNKDFGTTSNSFLDIYWRIFIQFFLKSN